MATPFGELVEPRSRAFWDSDEEDEPHAPHPKFEIAYKEVGITHQNQLFIIINGPLTTTFAETCLLHDAVLGAEVVNRTAEAAAVTGPRDYEAELVTPRKPHINSKIYRLNDFAILCVCSPDIPAQDAYFFTECIKHLLHGSERVVILNCETKASYITNDTDLPSAFLRGLRTKLYKGPELAPVVKAPNLIGGTAASLLTYCKIFDVPAVMYVVFTDSFVADSITTQPLIDVINGLDAGLLKEELPNFNSGHYHGAEVESNLYS